MFDIDNKVHRHFLMGYRTCKITCANVFSLIDDVSIGVLIKISPEAKLAMNLWHIVGMLVFTNIKFLLPLGSVCWRFPHRFDEN